MEIKRNIIFYWLFLFIYLEVLTKIFIVKSVGNIFFGILNTLIYIIIFYLLSNIFKEKGNKRFVFLSSIIIIIYYVFQCIFFRLFSIIFSFNSIGMAGNVIDFKTIAINVALKNWYILILYFIPLILLICFRKKINFKRDKLKNIFIYMGSGIVIYILSVLFLASDKAGFMTGEIMTIDCGFELNHDLSFSDMK